MNSRTMEEVLKEKGFLVTTAKGVSMLPLIRPDRDTIVLKAPKTDPKKFDVILYKRPNGTYILHRILGVREDGYILCGDNQVQKEYRVQKEQILGVLEGVYRGTQYVEVNTKKYRMYVYLWCRFLGVRKGILFAVRVVQKMKRIVRHLF